MAEHFKDVRVINLSPDGARAGVDLYFERSDNPLPANQDVEKLRRDYEETMFVLRNTNIPGAEFTTLVNQLKIGADVGLKGPNFSVEAGRTQLNQVQETLIGRARTSRDGYLIRLLLVGGAFAVIAIVLAAVLYFVVPRYLTEPEMATMYHAALGWLMPLMLIHPGAVLGAVFIGFAVNRTITFDKVRTFDPYYFPPLLRFFYIAIIGYVLFAALWFDFVMLGIGGYLLNNVKTDPAAGFAIGLACGIGEAAVVELLMSRLKVAERGTA
jgi:hypothetical protein